MVSHLLDTNAVIGLLARHSAPLLRRVKESAPQSLAVSAIVAHELWYGAYRSRKVVFNLETLRLLFADLPILEIGREDARASGEIRAELARQGKPIGPYDVLIAGQARARRLTLVTNNSVEFSRVPGLALEDWSVES